MTEPNQGAAAAQHEIIGAKKSAEDFHRTEHPNAQWFGHAALGLFQHWGIPSVSRRCDLSWGMMKDTPWDQHLGGENHMTPNEYWKLAERFNPSHYEPAKWLDAAADAGFTYAVLTTRHHDGYALWPSDYGELSTKNFAGGVDLVGPYVEACRNAGLKVGLYYSGPDWYVHRHTMSFNAANFGSHTEGADATGLDWEDTQLPAMPDGLHEAYLQYLHDQTTELLTRWGKVDLLWFDGGPAGISIDEIRALQPGIVINPRAHGQGDFSTAEGSDPHERPTGWWERCDLWARGGWGHTRQAYFSTSRVLGMLARTRAWGGNLLINAGPTAEGTMPDEFYQKLAEVKAWTDHSGKSVFGTTAGCWPDRATAPITCNGDTWYVHLLEPSVDKAVIHGVTKPAAVKALRLNMQLHELYVQWSDNTLTVTLPMDLRTDLDDVIAIEGVAEA